MGVIIPEVNVSISWSNNSSICITFDIQNLPTAYFSSPSCLEISIADYNNFTCCSTTHQVYILIKRYIGARCNFGDFLFTFLFFNKNIIVFKFIIFGESPKMNLISANSRKFKCLSLTSSLHNSNIIELI